MTGSGVVDGYDLRTKFAAWIDPLSTILPPVVIAGAGLSYQLVPNANEYGAEIGGRSANIEAALGISTLLIPVDAPTLYEWAGLCITALVAVGLAEADAKVRLAREMGLTTDPRFLSKANVPSRGTTPRHRVLSRLAREGRIESFWSFNWDCWLETSLESVGLRRGPRSGSALIAPPGWCLRYQVWFSGANSLVSTDTTSVFKAHGCVQALYDSNGEFVITAEEMARPLSEQPQERIHRMRKQISDRYVVTIGWSAAEGYVRQFFHELSASGMLNGRLAIVDINTSGDGHAEICKSFKTDTAGAGVKVNGSSPGSTDDLLLWVQTLRACESIRAACADYPVLQKEMDRRFSRADDFYESNTEQSSLISLIDNWLPAWLRICFFVGAQSHRFTAGNEFEVLPTEQRDAHIPWAPLSDRRDDLMSALSVLNIVKAKDSRWDLETFPGALWDSLSQELIIPVPIWAASDNVSSIQIKPITEGWRDRARISSVKILALDAPACELVDIPDRSVRLQRWKESIAACFSRQYLALTSNYEDIEISRLEEA